MGPTHCYSLDHTLCILGDRYLALTHISHSLAHSFNHSKCVLFPLLLLTQDDAELISEFVYSQGLNVLVQVATDADATFQQYILKGY